MPFSIVRQDITKMRVDAIVNAANENLLRGGGVCGAIFRAAGPEELQAACNKVAPVKTGSAAITPGFALPAKYVIHAVGPVYRMWSPAESRRLLYSAYANALRLAAENGCASIAFPLIASGIYGYPKAEALEVASQAIRDFLRDQPESEPELDVYLTVYDRAAFSASRALMGEVKSYIDENYVAEHHEPGRTEQLPKGAFWKKRRRAEDFAGFDGILSMLGRERDEYASEFAAFDDTAAPAAPCAPSASAAREKDEGKDRPEAEADLAPLDDAAAPAAPPDLAAPTAAPCAPPASAAPYAPPDLAGPAAAPCSPATAPGVYPSAPATAAKAKPGGWPKKPSKPAPAAAPPKTPPVAQAGPVTSAPILPNSLADAMQQLDEPFCRALLRTIDEKGRTDVEVYKRANIDRKLFSKIRTGKDGYVPSKRTILALAIALELTLPETDDLLGRAGYALSHSRKFDVIVEYFILKGRYDLYEINEVLFQYDQPLLGA